MALPRRNIIVPEVIDEDPLLQEFTDEDIPVEEEIVEEPESTIVEPIVNEYEQFFQDEEPDNPKGEKETIKLSPAVKKYIIYGTIGIICLLLALVLFNLFTQSKKSVVTTDTLTWSNQSLSVHVAEDKSGIFYFVLENNGKHNICVTSYEDYLAQEETKVDYSCELEDIEGYKLIQHYFMEAPE